MLLLDYVKELILPKVLLALTPQELPKTQDPRERKEEKTRTESALETSEEEPEDQDTEKLDKDNATVSFRLKKVKTLLPSLKESVKLVVNSEAKVVPRET